MDALGVEVVEETEELDEVGELDEVENVDGGWWKMGGRGGCRRHRAGCSRCSLGG